MARAGTRKNQTFDRREAAKSTVISSIFNEALDNQKEKGRYSLAQAESKRAQANQIVERLIVKKEAPVKGPLPVQPSFGMGIAS